MTSSTIFSRAYDQAAIKFRGVSADINFTLDDYKDDIKKVTTGRITPSDIMNRSEQMAALFVFTVLLFFNCFIKIALFAMH
jgi:hypothetical protein